MSPSVRPVKSSSIQSEPSDINSLLVKFEPEQLPIPCGFVRLPFVGPVAFVFDSNPKTMIDEEDDSSSALIDARNVFDTAIDFTHLNIARKIINNMIVQRCVVDKVPVPSPEELFPSAKETCSLDHSDFRFVIRLFYVYPRPVSFETGRGRYALEMLNSFDGNLLWNFDASLPPFRQKQMTLYGISKNKKIDGDTQVSNRQKSKFNVAYFRISLSDLPLKEPNINEYWNRVRLQENHTLLVFDLRYQRSGSDCSQIVKSRWLPGSMAKVAHTAAGFSAVASSWVEKSQSVFPLSRFADRKFGRSLHMGFLPPDNFFEDVKPIISSDQARTKTTPKKKEETASWFGCNPCPCSGEEGISEIEVPIHLRNPTKQELELLEIETKKGVLTRINLDTLSEERRENFFLEGNIMPNQLFPNRISQKQNNSVPTITVSPASSVSPSSDGWTTDNDSSVMQSQFGSPSNSDKESLYEKAPSQKYQSTARTGVLIVSIDPTEAASVETSPSTKFLHSELLSEPSPSRRKSIADSGASPNKSVAENSENRRKSIAECDYNAKQYLAPTSPTQSTLDGAIPRRSSVGRGGSLAQNIEETSEKEKQNIAESASPCQKQSGEGSVKKSEEETTDKTSQIPTTTDLNSVEKKALDSVGGNMSSRSSGIPRNCLTVHVKHYEGAKIVGVQQGVVNLHIEPRAIGPTLSAMEMFSISKA
eukprot:GHVP01049615.1.p1 GENE.GHVP01049615.1~~GHVP01049615.1.p1  ORF type:complete len:704 (-),score=115.44 GHVP01049615.1:550-2661(-)